MKVFTASDIKQLDKVYRLNLINSISGYKSANLIGTKGPAGENLSIISSVIHLGSKPALLGFIMRPVEPERHTYQNIVATEEYTINAVNEQLIKRAHYTSAKFDKDVSEFEACEIPSEYREDFRAPFVKESPLKMAMQLEQIVPIEANGTYLIIGSVAALYTKAEAIADNGQLDLNSLEVVSISGLNRYHKVKEIGNFPYARVSENPFGG